MGARVDITSLVSEVKELHDQFPSWTQDNAFVQWFLQAFLLTDSELASKCVTGVSHDKGIDAVYIDDSLKCAFLVQGKLHKADKPPQESRANVLSFARIASKITSSDVEFNAFRKNLNPLVAERLTEVRERVRKRDYEISLYYVTTGKCSSPLKAEAEAEASQANAKTSTTVLDRDEILGLLIDYIGGAAPPVPYLDLPVDAQGVIGSDGMIQRFDPKSGIESWILTMSGKQVGELYKRAGDRLFARNIRGFLGDGSRSINSGIKATLENEPENFWYFNNGVTIVCNGARKTSEHAQAVLRVTNPQVINGQQTTRVLSQSAANKATVIVRVINVPRRPEGNQSNFERLVSDIVAATNSQNAILTSDLRSNDERQVFLQREFAKLKYHYLRKRQSKGEARRIFRSQYGFWIKMDELAQVVGACELDPYITRSGKQGLFEPPYYDQIFDRRSVEEYLSIFWVSGVVKKVGSGHPDRAYAKWHALNFIWKSISPILKRRQAASEFRRQAERKQLKSAIYKLTDLTYLALLAFFRANRGKGASATDVSNFFYRPRQDKLFAKFWVSPANNKRRTQFSRSLAQLRKTLKPSKS